VQHPRRDCRPGATRSLVDRTDWLSGELVQRQPDELRGLRITRLQPLDQRRDMDRHPPIAAFGSARL
jgi:hypothetical protein